MGDEQHGAVERRERLFELLDRGQVEMVRRFVEHEAVHAGDREQREDSARAFAGRERARRSQHVLRAEPELRERRTARRHASAPVARWNASEQVPVAGEAVAGLVEPADDDGRAEPLRSRIERQLAEEGVQQGRLAAAVRAEDRDAFAVARSRGRSDRARSRRAVRLRASRRATTSPLRGAVATSMRSSHPTHGFSTAFGFEPLQRAGRSRAPCRRAARSTACGSDG